MKYEIIDINKWKRGKLFSYYIDNLRNVLSLTAEIDVTLFVRFVKGNGLKFYPAFMWAVSKIFNSREEFRYGWDKEGNLIRWDYISPYYADFHKDDEMFTLLYTEYAEDLLTFHDNFLKDRERYKDLRGFDFTEVPTNVFNVSCLPWLKYKSFDIHVFDEGKYLAPVVTWGKYEEKNGRLTMPLSVNIHHAVCDGFHLCRFFNELQTFIDSGKIIP